MRTIALIDGEHYPPVVRDALAELPHEFVAAVMLGGTEKLRGEADYGVPVFDSLEAAAAEVDAELVFDLSDEPVLAPPERLRLVSRTLALGLPYAGADFRFDPPPLAPFPLPSISVVGTGKRVGKTGLSVQLARLAAERVQVCVVAMGRGGPAEPELRSEPPSVEELIDLSRAGRHAASDYLEDAALAGVATVGARRCGGGLAGAVAVSNVHQAAEVARDLGPDIVIFEGSGAALPPVATDRRVLVVSGHQSPEVGAGYLNAFRILVSDLVVISFAEPGQRLEALRAAIAEVKPDVPIVATRLRPRSTVPAEGRRVALFTTAPAEAQGAIAAEFAARHQCEVVHVSGNLARRDALKAELETLDADLFLIELKAAAIDVVAEAAAARGVEVALLDNDLIALPGERDLEEELGAVVESVLKARVS